MSIEAREKEIAEIPAAGRDLFLVSAAHAVIHALAVLMPLIYPLIQIQYHLSYTQIGLIVAIPNAVGGNIGTLAVPLIAGPLLGMWGWRPVLYLAALPDILFGIAILILVDERNLLNHCVTRKQRASSREEYTGTSQWKDGLKAMFAPLRNRTLAIIMLVSIIAAGGRGLGNVTTYVPLYLQNIRHLDTGTISIFFTIRL